MDSDKKTWKSIDPGIEDRIRPLDLILFSGNEFVSKLIRFFEKKICGNGEFSHSGLIITSEVLPSLTQLIPGKFYVWESTVDTSCIHGDIMSETGNKMGVQLRELNEVVDSYTQEGGKLALCRLIDNPWDNMDRREEIVQIIEKKFKEHGHDFYEVNFCQCCASLFKCCRPIRDEMDEFFVEGRRFLNTMGLSKLSEESENKFFFCSEFVALIYQSIGLIPPEFKITEVVPMDFLGNDIDGMPKLAEITGYLG